MSGGISFFFFVFFTSSAHGLLQVRGNLASCTSLLVLTHRQNSSPRSQDKLQELSSGRIPRGKKCNKTINVITEANRWEEVKGTVNREHGKTACDMVCGVVW